MDPVYHLLIIAIMAYHSAAIWNTTRNHTNTVSILSLSHKITNP